MHLTRHTTTTLDSGVRVVSARLPGVRSVALGFWIDNGSAAETAEQAGLSHLLEHMLFRGSARYGSAEIDQIFDAMGAEINAGTGKETTSVYTRVLDGHLERALDVVSDMIWRPALGELEAEREVVLEEIAMYEDDPQDRVFDVLAEAIFGAHPLGRPVIGTAAVVGGVDRDTLAAFHGARCLPQRIVVAAAGSIEHDRLVELVRAAGPTGSGADDAAGAGPPPLEIFREHEPEVRFVRKDTEQYHVCIGAPAIPRDDDRRFALRVLDNILGGTSSSRLFQEVRERRGLAYSVFSFNALYAHTGQVGIYVGTRPDNLSQALAVVVEQIERMLEAEPDAEEIDRSRENVKGRMALSLESTAAHMNRLGPAVLADMPVLEIDEVIDRLDAVTAADVVELARELLVPSRLSVGAVGADEDTLRRALEPLHAAAGSASPS